MIMGWGRVIVMGDDDHDVTMAMEACGLRAPALQSCGRLMWPIMRLSYRQEEQRASPSSRSAGARAGGGRLRVVFVVIILVGVVQLDGSSTAIALPAIAVA